MPFAEYFELEGKFKTISVDKLAKCCELNYEPLKAVLTLEHPGAQPVFVLGDLLVNMNNKTVIDSKGQPRSYPQNLLADSTLADIGCNNSAG